MKGVCEMFPYEIVSTSLLTVVYEEAAALVSASSRRLRQHCPGNVVSRTQHDFAITVLRYGIRTFITWNLPSSPVYLLRQLVQLRSTMGLPRSTRRKLREWGLSSSVVGVQASHWSCASSPCSGLAVFLSAAWDRHQNEVKDPAKGPKRPQGLV
ncbi:hypothetical protein N7468_010651 [Penicillium chermesinum]|uniref:Uncharacterized protein n=1 Tax=Penicillium chermesinum TaxID=63820 RepID=A0A9W9N857_9EURO|nr:uncharacterized protein N7468_010651 [Penicillium chermesinum]KAJ5214972.1 hypothetical protein N7468_010651 [Penicillium chermesinum]